MGTLPITPAQFFQNNLFITSYGSVAALQAQLSYWTEELNFYARLLAWNLFGVSEETKPELKSSLMEIDRYRETTLPGFKADLEILKKQGRIPVKEELKRFEELSEQLKDLKLRIFPHASEFIQIKIW